MRSALRPVSRERTKGKRIAFALLVLLLLMPVTGEGRTPEAQKVLAYLRSLGNGSYMFGQMATWVHLE